MLILKDDYNKAEKINALAKAFERSVSSEIYEKLREELKGIE